MATFDPHILGFLSVTSGLAFAMVWLGARLHVLELRRTPRRCPSCGIAVRRGATCRCSG